MLCRLYQARISGGFNVYSHTPKAQTKKRHAQQYAPPYVIYYMSRAMSVDKLSGLGRYTKLYGLVHQEALKEGMTP